jgi:hypothetical protein
LAVVKVRERLTVSKRAAQEIDTDRFNVKKLNKGDFKEQYQVTIRNNFAALENLRGQWGHQEGMGQYYSEYKHSGKESLGNYESKRYKPCSDV